MGRVTDYSYNSILETTKLVGVPVAVTGATGFIGCEVVRALCVAGAAVTTLHRSGHGRKSMRCLGARPLHAPLEPGARLTQAMSGQRILFHLAYDFRAGGEANLQAFDAVLEAAIEAGVERIVHAGSAVVYDTWPEGRVDETAPWSEPVDDVYRQVKRTMDRRLLSAPVAVAILQPTIVYGPGSTLWIDRPVAAMRQGGIVLPEPMGNCPAVFVEDVVQAVVRAAILPDLGRERFVISGPDSPGWMEYWQAIRDLAGGGDILREPLEQMRANLPPPTARGLDESPPLAARVSALARRVIGHRGFEHVVAQARRLRGPTGPVRPDHAALTLFAAHPMVCTDRAKARLGYIPKVSFPNGIKACRMPRDI